MLTHTITPFKYSTKAVPTPSKSKKLISGAPDLNQSNYCHQSVTVITVTVVTFTVVTVIITVVTVTVVTVTVVTVVAATVIKNKRLINT